MKVDFEEECIHYQHLNVPMEPVNGRTEVNYITNIEEPKSTAEALDRVKDILVSKYALLPQQIIKKCTHLFESQKESLLPILEKHKSVFDDTLGKWRGI